MALSWAKTYPVSVHVHQYLGVVFGAFFALRHLGFQRGLAALAEVALMCYRSNGFSGSSVQALSLAPRLHCTLQRLYPVLRYPDKSLQLLTTCAPPELAECAAGSWQMDNRGTTMCAREFDFGFAVDWVRKDLGMAFDEAEKIGADLTVTKQLDSYYEEVQKLGGGRWDTSSLIARIK